VITQLSGNPTLDCYVKSNLVASFSGLGLASNNVTIVFTSTSSENAWAANSVVEFSGQRGEPFYSGLNWGISAAVAAASVIYLLRALKSGARSMVSGGD